MRKFNYLSAIAIAIGLFFVACEQQETAVPNLPNLPQAIEGQYIIVYNTNVTGDAGARFVDNYAGLQNYMRTQTQEILSENSVDRSEIITTYGRTINGAAVRLSEMDVERLRADERVAYIEQDRIYTFAPPCGTPNGGPCEEDPGDGDGSTSQETPYGIVRVNGITEYTGSNVAWVIDTGIDLDHPDLNVDATRGFNAFTTGRDAKSLDDGNGHGSHVAGTIAALNNSEGVIGVAPGAVVVPVKVLDSRGSGSYSGVIAGVDHVAANGSNGDVANMSLGGPVSDALDDAVLAASQKGIFFSLAAGNSSEDANNSSPARVNGSYIVTISAMDSSDGWASFSNFGNPPVDFCAPGVSVKSTWKDGGYNTISGTSMAAPHAAGVLLIGSAGTDSYVNGDPDGDPDPIIVH